MERKGKREKKEREKERVRVENVAVCGFISSKASDCESQKVDVIEKRGYHVRLILPAARVFLPKYIQSPILCCAQPISIYNHFI